MTLEELVAKQEIAELLHRYCRGIDRFDWDLVRGCYHDDADDDHGIFRGGPDELIAFLKEFLGTMTTATMHTLTNVIVSLDGDTAGAESHILAWHRLAGDDGPPKIGTVGGRYVDRLERRQGVWRIAQRTVVWEWTNVEPVGEEFDAGPDAVSGRRDRTDLSYTVLQHQPVPVTG